jgi:hypothetical protein
MSPPISIYPWQADAVASAAPFAGTQPDGERLGIAASQRARGHSLRQLRTRHRKKLRSMDLRQISQLSPQSQPDHGPQSIFRVVIQGRGHEVSVTQSSRRDHVSISTIGFKSSKTDPNSSIISITIDSGSLDFI